MRHSIAAALVCVGLAGCGQTERPDQFNQNLKPGEVVSLIEDRALVFFDQGSAELNGGAVRVMDALKPAYWLHDAVLVEITGHTDRTGSAAPNQLLSQRRAEAVRDALVARGVREDILVIRGRGENDPLVPTDDGKAEPQNRRVDICARRS
ncbi:MAG: OmpA family protein [Inquilinus limosus]|uniref:OmpA family protein n=1 Tax=Inquilinus limosus TaxID=171674 RepID=A0A952FPZ8_9PROT|nr:OmpA family protein [Inquilinus limosus]